MTARTKEISQGKMLRYLPASMYQPPREISHSGFEIEMAIVDENGEISNAADTIVEECKRIDKKFPISEEVGKNMIEIHALPHRRIQKAALFLLDNVETVMRVCEKHVLFLLPLATYPGMFKEQIQQKKRYLYSAKSLDELKYNYFFSHCFGFHYHYSLPRGVVNRETRSLNGKIYTKTKEILLNGYNFLIAADPVITLFSQSSPFEGGRYYAKDSRMLFLRGGVLEFDGLFNDYQELGALQPYRRTLSDLIYFLRHKDKLFKKLMMKANIPKEFVKKKGKLDFMWNPVKINQIGTLEQRGMDTNLLNISLSISVMIKFILRAIHYEQYHVLPSDAAVREPFKLEGKMILIPPHMYVRNELQYRSAYYGLADREMYKAAAGFVKLARKMMSKEYRHTIKPIEGMLEKRKTVSDQILQYVRKKGYSTKDILPQEVSCEIALRYANKLVKEIEKTKKMFGWMS